MWQPGKVVRASAVAAALALVVVMAHPLNHVASQKQVQVTLKNEVPPSHRWLDQSVRSEGGYESQACWYDADIPQCQ